MKKYKIVINIIVGILFAFSAIGTVFSLVHMLTMLFNNYMESASLIHNLITSCLSIILYTILSVYAFARKSRPTVLNVFVILLWAYGIVNSLSFANSILTILPFMIEYSTFIAAFVFTGIINGDKLFGIFKKKDSAEETC